MIPIAQLGIDATEEQKDLILKETNRLNSTPEDYATEEQRALMQETDSSYQTAREYAKEMLKATNSLNSTAWDSATGEQKDLMITAMLDQAKQHLEQHNGNKQPESKPDTATKEVKKQIEPKIRAALISKNTHVK